MAESEPNTLTQRSSSAAAHRILVRGVNWLGDAVMATPALARLREAHPAAHITLLTHEKLGELWQHHPAVTEVITFAPEESPWSVARRLRQGRFETVLVLPNSSRSALEGWLARIPVRVGYARPWRNWFLTQPLPTRPGHLPMRKRSVSEVERLIAPRAARGTNPSADRRTEADHAESRTTAAHQIHEYLYLAAALGANPAPLAPNLHVTPAELEATNVCWLDRLRARHAALAPGKPLICFGLNPSAAYGAAKRWPAENFAAVAREISRRNERCVWLAFGGPGDVELCDEIARRAGGGVLNLAGKTPLRELMALLKLCRVLLTNDSGPMHVAAALGTPVVVPFGSTSPVLTGPGLPGDPRHHLLTVPTPCAPCFRRECPIDLRCLTGITVERTVEAVLRAQEFRDGEDQQSPNAPSNDQGRGPK